LTIEFVPWNAGSRTSGFAVAMKEVFVSIGDDIAALHIAATCCCKNATLSYKSLSRIASQIARHSTSS
jgi:hypothetical protein